MKTPDALNLPAELLYTSEHVWVKKEGNDLLVGISDYAQDQLGEVAFVDLPSEGQQLPEHGEFGSVESVKSVNALYMPVAGTVSAINGELEDNPSLVNADCYGQGWLVRVTPDNAADVDKLMQADAYRGSLA